MFKSKLKKIFAVTAFCALTLSGTFFISNTNLHKTVANTIQNQPTSENKNFALFITDDNNKLETLDLINAEFLEPHNIIKLICNRNVENEIASKNNQVQNADQLKNDLKNIFEQKGVDETVKLLNENYKKNICNYISLKESQLSKMMETIGKKYIDQNQDAVFCISTDKNQKFSDITKVIIGMFKELKTSNSNLSEQDCFKAVVDMLKKNC